MNPEQVAARCAIEALRSGVPSRHAVQQLGTTQDHIREAFETRLASVAEGAGIEPLVISANFGAGKSHLLNYLKVLATNRSCVTSFVVVSPEMPLGNAHVVLKVISEAAEAPGRLGGALRALAGTLTTGAPGFADLRLWARDAGLDDRFPAMLHLYEELRADEEFRTQILGDIEGSPLTVTLIRQKLKDLGQAAGYSLKGVKNSTLAHDRIRLLARFYRACGCRGWVILFDELERVERFTTKQRMAAWQELGWWQEIAREEGAGILPVFAIASGAFQVAIESDEPRFQSHALGLEPTAGDRRGLAAIQMASHPARLTSLDAEQHGQIRYRLKSIYEDAYGVRVDEARPLQNDVRTSIRSEIRRWITVWDLQRCYPGSGIEMVEEAVPHDDNEIGDDALPPDDSEASA